MTTCDEFLADCIRTMEDAIYRARPCPHCRGRGFLPSATAAIRSCTFCLTSGRPYLEQHELSIPNEIMHDRRNRGT